MRRKGLPVDLNAGTNGERTFLCYKRGTTNPVTDIQVGRVPVVRERGERGGRRSSSVACRRRLAVHQSQTTFREGGGRRVGRRSPSVACRRSLAVDQAQHTFGEGNAEFGWGAFVRVASWGFSCLNLNLHTSYIHVFRVSNPNYSLLECMLCMSCVVSTGTLQQRRALLT